MKRLHVSLAVMALIAWSAGADVVQLDISSVFNYDNVVTAEEISYCNTFTGVNHRVIDILGQHNTVYGSTYYSNGTDNAFPTDGLVGGVSGDYYEIGKGLTYRYGVPAGDTLDHNTLYLDADNSTASQTITLLGGQQAQYADLNILFVGKTYDSISTEGLYSASVKAKYVGDATLYTVWEQTTGADGIGGSFGTSNRSGSNGGFQSTDTLDPTTWSVAYTANPYATNGGGDPDRYTYARSGDRYLWEFTTPLDLDETKVLESIEITVTSGGVNRDNEVWIYAMSATPVPEPATMGLLAFGGIALLKRRRK